MSNAPHGRSQARVNAVQGLDGAPAPSSKGWMDPAPAGRTSPAGDTVGCAGPGRTRFFIAYLRKYAYSSGMDYADAESRAAVLKALAHPIRVLLLDALRRGDRCVGELMGVARVDPSTISRHLAQLKRAGIVTERREGVRIIHHLACPCMLRALECSMDVLHAVQRRNRAATRRRRS